MLFCWPGLLFAGGGVVQGTAIVLLASVWGISRVRPIIDLTQAGNSTRFRARVEIARAAILFAVYLAVLACLLYMARSAERKTTAGQIAVWALTGVTILVYLQLRRTDQSAVNWLRGGQAEKTVGTQLDELRDQGWVVMHGLPTSWGGDIDHIACGPRGAFVIETKSGHFRRADLAQATRNAVWVKRALGIPWATGVLCVGDDLPPAKHQHAWVMGHDRLVGWLQQQHGRPVDPELSSATLTALANEENRMTADTDSRDAA